MEQHRRHVTQQHGYKWQLDEKDNLLTRPGVGTGRQYHLLTDTTWYRCAGNHNGQTTATNTDNSNNANTSKAPNQGNVHEGTGAVTLAA